MTFDDDFVQLQFSDGQKRRVFCKPNSIDWPPPATLALGGFRFTQLSCSELTDEQRAGMSHVCRGAAYLVCTEGADVIPDTSFGSLQ